ncbi:ferrochelatase [Alcaligenes endophyticus]|uniref:Ferrochelatase n=1 Tax=Alcaligenes endophyticus TaxID=1929088 RepID=A0ABT8EH98_9BURK|nr:ferrochelatase [Alcaligenes endophyticus]MCX5589677.1 ferrochelatase [Alcaligenes endophyticus]MDN4120659.1 ferrochelatase [Alcaligenes endophyticus]
MSKIFASPYLPEAADPTLLASEPQSIQPPGPIGIVLINLGTPAAPNATEIRRYLKEFLSDPRVIEIPPFLWQIILRLFILPRRPAKLAPRYQDIWLPEGAPLLVWSQAQADGLQSSLQARGYEQVFVELGMRYGQPSLISAVEALRAKGCQRILALPLYPQYAASTTATAFDYIAEHMARLRDQPEWRTVKRYHVDPGYIGALANKVRQYWHEHGKPERLLLSFHGLPRRCAEQGDPYYRDCLETSLALKAELADQQVPIHVSFQSRFGAERWLEPYTEPLLREWAKQGVARVDAMCPGFLADCLETLEEIQIECRDAFVEDGGQQLRYIPCLNADSSWVEALTDLALRHLSGWVSHDNTANT